MRADLSMGRLFDAVSSLLGRATPSPTKPRLRSSSKSWPVPTWLRYCRPTTSRLPVDEIDPGPLLREMVDYVVGGREA